MWVTIFSTLSIDNPDFNSLKLNMKDAFYSSRLICLLVVVSTAFCFDVAGQTVEDGPAAKTISGGLVTGKAKTLPQPQYPESARIAKITGEVKVQVLIDEKGTVISAKAVDGVEDLALRQASEAAAMKATFSPTLLSGQPVRVSGVISYNFVADVVSNEEKVKLMALSAFLTVAKSFSNDAQKLREAFEGEDILGGMIAEFPEFSADLKEVSAFDRNTPDKRVQSVNTAIAAIRAKVGTESDRWQLDVGVALGELMGPMMVIMVSGSSPSELANLDEVKIREYLSRLGELAAKPPLDFPKDILEKLTDLSALSQRNKILQGENLDEFGKRLLALMETISPTEDEPTEN
jgi:TonB family protein